MNIEYDKIHSRQDSISFQGPEQLLSENMIFSKNFGSRKEEAMLECKICFSSEHHNTSNSNDYKIIINDSENIIKPCKCKGFSHDSCMIMWILKSYFIKCPQCSYVFNLSLDKTVTKVSYDSLLGIVKYLTSFFISLVLSILSFLNVLSFERINSHWCVIIGIIFLTISVFNILYILDSQMFRKTNKYFFQIKLNEYREDNSEDLNRISTLSKDFQLFISHTFNVQLDCLIYSIRETLLETDVKYSERRLAKFIDNEQRHVSNGLKSQMISYDPKSLKASAKYLLWSFKDRSKLKVASNNILSPYVPHPVGPSFQNFIGNKSMCLSKESDKENNEKEFIIYRKGNKNDSPVVNYMDFYRDNNIVKKHKMDLALNFQEIEEVEYDYSEMNSHKGTIVKIPRISLMNHNTNIKHKFTSNSIKELNNTNKRKFYSTRLDMKPQSLVMNCDSINNGSRIASDKGMNERCSAEIKEMVGNENFVVNTDLEINMKVRSIQN